MNAKNELKADAVFEGGGVKGVGLVGAVAVAEKMGYQWQNVAGTSAGAIVAALLAAGYRATEMKKIMDELDYKKFKDTSPLDRVWAVGPVASLIFEKGIYEGKWFKNWMGGLLKDKGIKTFGDLIHPEFKDDKRYRFKLRVIASDISRGRMLVLPQDIENFGIRAEDLDVTDAIRMSMSIPFFYEPVKLKDKKTGQASYVVDGGLLSNFPVWLFDTEGAVPEWPTFGFKLVEPSELGGLNLVCPYDEKTFATFELLEAHLKAEHQDADVIEFICPYLECEAKKFASLEALKTHLYSEHIRHKIRGPISLLIALFSTMSEAHDARYLKDADFVRTIPIPTLDVRTTDFDLKPEKSEALYESGRQAAERFFTTWDFTKYVNKYRSSKPCEERGPHLRS